KSVCSSACPCVPSAPGPAPSIWMKTLPCAPARKKRRSNAAHGAAASCERRQGETEPDRCDRECHSENQKRLCPGSEGSEGSAHFWPPARRNACVQENR